MQSLCNQSKGFRTGRTLGLESLENRQLMDGTGLLVHGTDAAVEYRFHDDLYGPRLSTNELLESESEIAKFDSPSFFLADRDSDEDKKTPKLPPREILPIPERSPTGGCFLKREPAKAESESVAAQLGDPDKIGAAIADLDEEITELENDIEELRKKIDRGDLGAIGNEFAGAYQADLEALRDGLVKNRDILSVDQAIAEIDKDLKEPYERRCAQLIEEAFGGQQEGGKTSVEKDDSLNEFISALEGDRAELKALRKRLVDADK